VAANPIALRKCLTKKPFFSLLPRQPFRSKNRARAVILARNLHFFRSVKSFGAGLLIAYFLSAPIWANLSCEDELAILASAADVLTPVVPRHAKPDASTPVSPQKEWFILHAKPKSEGATDGPNNWQVIDELGFRMSTIPFPASKTDRPILLKASRDEIDRIQVNLEKEGWQLFAGSLSHSSENLDFKSVHVPNFLSYLDMRDTMRKTSAKRSLAQKNEKKDAKNEKSGPDQRMPDYWDSYDYTFVPLSLARDEHHPQSARAIDKEIHDLIEAHPLLSKPSNAITISFDFDNSDDQKAIAERLERTIQNKQPSKIIFGVESYSGEKVGEYLKDLKKKSFVLKTPAEKTTVFGPLTFGSLAVATAFYHNYWLYFDIEHHYNTEVEWQIAVVLPLVARALFGNKIFGPINQFFRATIDSVILTALASLLYRKADLSPTYTMPEHHLFNAASLFLIGAMARTMGTIVRNTYIGNIVHALTLAAGGTLWATQDILYNRASFVYLPMLLAALGVDKLLTSFKVWRNVKMPSTNEESLRSMVDNPAELDPMHYVRKLPLDAKNRKALINDLKLANKSVAKELKKNPNAEVVVHEFLVPKKGVDPSDKDPKNWTFIQLYTVQSGVF
jgi:hypothetical protein